MRKLWTVITLTGILLLSQRGWTDEASHRQLSTELLELMKVDEMTDKMFEQIKMMQKAQFAQAGLPAESINLQDKIMEIMAQELSWDALKNDYIKLYVDTFSEEDLKGLIDFYKSPLGQKFVEKTPELMEKSMQISQRRTMELLPKIQQMTEQMYPVQTPSPVPLPPEPAQETK